MNEQTMIISEYLISVFGFKKVYSRNDELDFEKFDCALEIYPHCFLFYSNLYKCFSLVQFHERPRGLPGGGVETYKSIMIPRLIKTYEDADKLLGGFSIYKTK